MAPSPDIMAPSSIEYKARIMVSRSLRVLVDTSRSDVEGPQTGSDQTGSDPEEPRILGFSIKIDKVTVNEISINKVKIPKNDLKK